MNILRQWLIKMLGGTVLICEHKWRVMIEHYPTYAWDKWECKQCGASKDFPNSKPPAPIEEGICSMGHVHITNNKPMAKAVAKA